MNFQGWRSTPWHVREPLQLSSSTPPPYCEYSDDPRGWLRSNEWLSRCYHGPDQYTRPAPNITRPRDNVIVRLCSIECNFAMEMADPSNAAFQKDMVAWAKVSSRTYIWNL